MTDNRVRRGRKSQEIAAEYWCSRGFPGAHAIAASLPGMDVLGMDGLHPEVKATRGDSILSALKQATKGAEGTGRLPFVLWRPQGYGPAKIDEWVGALWNKDLTTLLRMAGYGEGR